MRATTLLPALALAALLAPPPAQAATADEALARAIHNPARSAKFTARDAVRHPTEELAFFGLTPTSHVVEIWPGGGYWTEILAPYLAKSGKLTVALPPAKDAEEARFAKRFMDHVKQNPALFPKLDYATLGPDNADMVPAGSADLVLTFRNLHNWMGGDYAEHAFATFFRALKPGGVLGIEEHRGLATKPQDPKAQDGYVRQDYTIELARKAGFVFEGASEINANPKDTKEWAEGVWTLPPTLALGAKDRAKYEAIGEADNYVLKFRKPGG